MRSIFNYSDEADPEVDVRTTRVNRTLLSRFAADALGERGPWILDPEGEVFLLMSRRLRGGRGVVGLALAGGSSGGGGTLEVALALPTESGWRVIPSYWSLLGFLSQEDVDRAILDPSHHWEELVDGISGFPPDLIGRKAFSSVEEAEGALIEILSSRTSSERRPGGIGTEILQKIVKMLDAGTLEDRSFSFKMKFGVLLGSWTAGAFDREFNVGLETMRLLELEALRTEDISGGVPKVDEFSLVGEISASAERNRAVVEVDVIVRLYWIHLDMTFPDVGGRLIRRRWQAGHVRLSELPEGSMLQALMLDGTLWGKISSRALRVILTRLKERLSPLLSEEAALRSGNPNLRRMMESAGVSWGEEGLGGRGRSGLSGA